MLPVSLSNTNSLLTFQNRTHQRWFQLLAAAIALTLLSASTMANADDKEGGCKGEDLGRDAVIAVYMRMEFDQNTGQTNAVPTGQIEDLYPVRQRCIKPTTPGAGTQPPCPAGYCSFLFQGIEQCRKC